MISFQQPNLATPVVEKPKNPRDEAKLQIAALTIQVSGRPVCFAHTDLSLHANDACRVMMYA